MKKNRPINRYIVLGLIVILVALIGIFNGSGWISRLYEQKQAKHTLSAELQKLNAPLRKMGFDYKKIDADCNDHKNGDKLERYCSAHVNSYVVYRDKNNLDNLKEESTKLSDALNKNGWHQREDYPTVSWFTKISEGVDYQPDQLNKKQVGQYACIVDFFTSFSKPALPAITLMAMCDKGQPPVFLD